MSENRPHVLYLDKMPEIASVFSSYAEAHSVWLEQDKTEKWVIATLGRIIDPSTPVIDPNE